MLDKPLVDFGALVAEGEPNPTLQTSLPYLRQM